MHRNWLHIKTNLLLLVILIGPVEIIKLKHLILVQKLGRKWKPIRFTASKFAAIQFNAHQTRPVLILHSVELFYSPKMRKADYALLSSRANVGEPIKKTVQNQSMSCEVSIELYISSKSK